MNLSPYKFVLLYPEIYFEMISILYIYIVDSQKYTNVLSFFIEKPKEYDREYFIVIGFYSMREINNY